MKLTSVVADIPVDLFRKYWCASLADLVELKEKIDRFYLGSSVYFFLYKWMLKAEE